MWIKWNDLDETIHLSTTCGEISGKKMTFFPVTKTFYVRLLLLFFSTLSKMQYVKENPCHL